ncbi:MAG: hypothetical protein U0790_00080 [Isosphaeraceae bacterium]
MTPTLILGGLKFLANHKALITAGLGAAYLASQGQYTEAIALVAAALSGGLKRPSPQSAPAPTAPPPPAW